MRLLKIELKKIVGNKSFKVFGIMFLIFLPLLAILLPAVFSVQVGDEDFYMLRPDSYSSTWYATSYISSWFCFFFLSFTLIYHITNEYNYRTVRQNVIDGFSRKDYLKGKVYLMVTLLLTATFYVFIIGLIGGIFFSSFEPKDPGVIQEFFSSMNGSEDFEQKDFGNVLDGSENVLRFFVQNLGGFSLAFLVAFLVKRGIIAVLLYFGIFLAEKIVGLVLMGNGLETITEYLPLYSIKEVLPNPGIVSLLSGVSNPESLGWHYIFVTIGLSILFIFLSKLLFFKRDIS